MIDLNAPILPWHGLGGLKLKSHISEHYNIVEKYAKMSTLLGKFLIRYELNESVDLWFNLVNGKLFKITALRNYKGKLFDKIYIGMPIEDVLNLEPTFIYDEFEEVYCSSKGIYIETDPVNETVLWISVYIKEIENDDFQKGNW